ncbi:hypothetical protein KGA65_15080 [Ideonella sp. B7]|nr:hypothetical protein [Ideonella benzenivorans]
MAWAGAALSLGLASCSSVPTPGGSAAGRGLQAAPEVAARSWADYQVRAAQRMVAANPGRTYLGPVPEPLLAIPVLEIELKADGSVAHINVKREPRQAKDTIQLAIDAVRRGAPYGDVRQLPKPWKFTEVFLFNDDRQFKPRTLDD